MKQSNQENQQVTKVLICGNTRLLEEESIRQVAKYYSVLVAGEISFPKFSTKRVRFYDESPETERFDQLCNSFSPEAIWFISGYADGGEGMVNEVKMLEGMMNVARKQEVQKVIMVSTIHALDAINLDASEIRLDGKVTERSFCCEQNERLVKYLAAKYERHLVLLRVPFIARRVNRENYLGEIFRMMEQKEGITLPFGENNYIDFLSLSNLVELLLAVTEENGEWIEEYSVYSGFPHVYGDLGKGIRELCPEIQVEYQDHDSSFYGEQMESAGRIIRKKYGYVANDDVLSNLKELYENYRMEQKPKNSIGARWKSWFEVGSGAVQKVLELLLLFALSELLVYATSGSVYFRFVDIRLFYIVVIAICHGMGMGILAGLLECVSLFLGYRQVGVNATMLFYNMDYWLPFVLYLLSGSVIGYVKNTYQQKIYFVEEENQVLKDKYVFLNNVYQQVIDNKSEYKRQILGYQDSFGKIFEAVQDLDGTVTSEIFGNGVEILERILDNHSVAIYTLDEQQHYMRLAACSREMGSRLMKSVKVAEYQRVYDCVISDTLWKNTDFTEGLPIYAFGVNKNEKSRVIIALYEAENSQLGLYYSNLFSILCNLIRMSFERAYEYQLAIEDEKYLEGTEIMKEEYFREILDIQDKMEEAGLASYALLKFSSEDYHMINDKILGLIRQNDVLGFLEDGHVHLLLTQVTNDNLSIVGERLLGNGLAFEIERD